MRTRRELMALVVTAVIGVLMIILFLYVEDLPSSRFERAQEQNAGSDAPRETLPPADSGLRDGEE